MKFECELNMLSILSVVRKIIYLKKDHFQGVLILKMNGFRSMVRDYVQILIKLNVVFYKKRDTR